MGDLGRAGILAKAILFVVVIGLGATGIVIRDEAWAELALLAVTLWAACRLYYFLFHVLEHWLGVPGRYAGLLDLARRLASRRRG